MAQDVVYSIGADTSDFTAKMKGIGQQALAMGAAFLGVQSVTAVMQKIGEALKAVHDITVKTQESFAIMSTTVKNAAGGSQAMIDKMKELSQEMGVTTGEGAAAVADAFNNLTLKTGDARVALESMNAAVGLSKAAHISLEMATNLVARAYERGGAAVARYLPDIRDVGNGMEAVRAITNKTNGELEAFTETLQGAEKQSGAMFEEMANNVGGLLAPEWQDFLNNAVKPTLTAINDILKGLHNVDADADTLDHIESKLQNLKDLQKEGLLKGAAGDNLQAQIDMVQKEYEKAMDKYAEKALNPGTIGAAPEKPANKTSDEEEPTDKMDLMNEYIELDIEQTKAQEEENEKRIKDQIEFDETMEQLDNERNKANIDGLTGTLSKIRSLQVGHNSVLFNMAKAAGIAEIGIDTAQAIMKTLAAGGMFAVPESIAIGAIGAQQLAAAVSTQINSAGAASGVFDWRAPANVEHMVTTISPGESILTQAQTAALMGGNNNGGGNFEFHSHIHASGLNDAGEIMKNEILPAFKGFLIEQRGGQVAMPDGTPNW